MIQGLPGVTTHRLTVRTRTDNENAVLLHGENKIIKAGYRSKRGTRKTAMESVKNVRYTGSQHR